VKGEFVGEVKRGAEREEVVLKKSHCTSSILGFFPPQLTKPLPASSHIQQPVLLTPTELLRFELPHTEIAE
jgi:hypothetical protein